MKVKTSLQIFHEMKDTYEDNGSSVCVIQYWVRKFKFIFSSVRDEVRSGRPVDSTNYHISKVKALVFEDRRMYWFVRRNFLAEGLVESSTTILRFPECVQDVFL